MKFKFVHNSTCVDDESKIRLSDLTFEDLCPHYGTGRSMFTGRDRYGGKMYSYRSGIATNMGDVEISVWKKLAIRLIERAGETELFSSLKNFQDENRCGSNSDFEQHVLELHIRRVFDDPAWVGFVKFNKLYRPVILKKANLLRVICCCCEQEGVVTRERIDRDGPDKVICPVCGKYSEYRICEPE